MDFPKVEQPEGLSVKLFDHQLTSIYNMEKLENNDFAVDIYNNDLTRRTRINTRIGIFGDMPGYGKSLSIVGLILRDRMKVGETFNHVYRHYHHQTYNSLYEIEETHTVPVINCSLIVAGPSIVKQWEEYFSYSPLRIETVLSKKDIETLNPTEFDVVLVVPSMYNEFCKKHRNKYWKRFIYDEPTSVHIPAMHFCEAVFYWFVTATYSSLNRSAISGNSGHMLVQIFGSGYYSMPDIYRRMLIINPVNYVKESFSMPATHYVRHPCYASAILDVIGDFIDQNTAQLICAGDIKKAVSSLGGEFFNGSIIDYVSSKIRKELENNRKKIEEMLENPPINPTAIVAYNYQSKINDFRNYIIEGERQLKKIEDRFKRMIEDNDCPICADVLSKPVMVKCCQNVFCGQCLFGWLQGNKTCPYCRAPLKLKELVHIDIDGKEDDDQSGKGKEEATPKLLGRPEAVTKLLKDLVRDKEKRVILFSSSDHTFSIIKSFLKESNLKYGEVKGSSVSRSKILQSYREGEIQVIFLNSIYNGAGINLQNTTDIIIYHDMHPDTVKQVTGRALRIGRTIDLYIHQMYETISESAQTIYSSSGEASSSSAV